MMATIQSILWNQQSDEVLVYKYPVQDINTGSVLTVNDSQEAYFYRNGTLYDKFSAGRYALSSSNLPALSDVVNLASGGESTFNASIWFVSKLAKRNILWGAGGLRVIDPYFEIPIKMSARGQYGIRIKDGGLFILKFVGTQAESDMNLIYEQFRSDVIEAVKVSIARFMKEMGVNVNELGTEYRSLGTAISKELQLTFDEYGVELLNFNIEDISFNENDPGYQKVMEGISERARLNKLGVDYVQQRQLDITQTVAGNQGAGVFMGAGAGLSLGSQAGQIFGEVMKGNPASQIQVAAPAPPSMPSFYVASNGNTEGPFRLDVIHDKIIKGQIGQSTYLYKVGGNAWMAAGQTPEILSLFSSMTPPPPPSSHVE